MFVIVLMGFLIPISYQSLWFFNGISLTNKKKWFTFFQTNPLFASWCIPFFVKKTSGRFWGRDFQENISNWWLHAYSVQTRGPPDILISKEWLWIPRHSRAQLKIASAMTCWAYLLTIHIQLMVFSCRNGPFQPIFEDNQQILVSRKVEAVTYIMYMNDRNTSTCESRSIPFVILFKIKMPIKTTSTRRMEWRLFSFFSTGFCNCTFFHLHVVAALNTSFSSSFSSLLPLLPLDLLSCFFLL